MSNQIDYNLLDNYVNAVNDVDSVYSAIASSYINALDDTILPGLRVKAKTFIAFIAACNFYPNFTVTMTQSDACVTVGIFHRGKQAGVFKVNENSVVFNYENHTVEINNYMAMTSGQAIRESIDTVISTGAVTELSTQFINYLVSVNNFVCRNHQVDFATLVSKHQERLDDIIKPTPPKKR